MKKPKIRLNQEPISENDALKYKDFKGLINSQAASLPSISGNTWKFVLGALGLIVIAGFFYMANKKITPAVIANKPQTKKNELVRPFPNIPVEYETFRINTNERSEIRSKDGSVIIIPENTIVDAQGDLVKGEVELRYREFRDMVDVFLSGIPMVYDTLGTQKHFESAGMFELLAFQKDQPVFIDPSKKVTIEFASQHQAGNYNIYNYDQEQQEWVYMYKDTSKLNDGGKTPDLKEQLEMVNKEIDLLEKNIALKPVLANPKRIRIKMDVLEKEFPEIAIYNNVKFEILGEEKFDPTLNNEEWDMAKVLKGEEEKYLLHFERGTEIKEFSCIPVFEKEDYAAAKKLFEEKHKASLALIKEKEDTKDKLNKKYLEEKSTLQLSLTDFKSVRNNSNRVMSNQEMITRVFTINRFGIFNSDCPKNLPKGSMFALKLRDSSEVDKTKLLKCSNIYLVERNKNALYTYYDPGKFSYNPKSKNIAWTLTSDNKLAIFSSAEFNKIRKAGKGEERVFDMNVIKVNFTSEAQIRKYLEI